MTRVLSRIAGLGLNGAGSVPRKRNRVKGEAQRDEKLATTKAGMRARSYHASPGEVTSAGGCAHKLVDELCRCARMAVRCQRTCLEGPWRPRPAVTSADAGDSMGCEKIRTRSRPYRHQRVIHT